MLFRIFPGTFQFILGSSDQAVYYFYFSQKIIMAVLKIFIIEIPEKNIIWLLLVW